MFKLLSKESNIFSIPIYIGFLLVIVIAFNILSYNSGLQIVSAIITFVGIALGYFCFNSIALNHQTHLPLFLYTFFVFAFYPGDLDIGIAVTLLTNSFIVLIITSKNEEIRKTSYLLVGVLVAINYIFLPTTWPMIAFVMIHIIANTDRIALQLFRFFYGGILVGIAYFSLMYFLDFRSWDESYFPLKDFTAVQNFSALYPLIPIAILFLFAIFDGYSTYNKKSPINKYKYTFLLLYTLVLLTTIVLYMGNDYQYLILLSLPLSIILSRMLQYLPKYWMKELGLWLIVLCLFTYKIKQYF